MVRPTGKLGEYLNPRIVEHHYLNFVEDQQLYETENDQKEQFSLVLHYSIQSNFVRHITARNSMNP
jgi:hypothetical protein|tara:strand:- start:780 stop:977 length:198 start_codon:yes stop_codon:yes gene_type:complete